MTDASGALAAQSPWAGVLFYGLPGGGKTACALELAYHFEQTGRFDTYVWYAPEDDDEPTVALRNFADCLDARCAAFPSDLKLAEIIERMDTDPGQVQRITECFRQMAALVFVDGVERLLTPAREWRDHRWSIVISAICASGGLSRLVLTSRARPRDFGVPLRVVQVNALTVEEELVLVDELPNLDRLARNTSDEWHDNDGSLVYQVTRIAQGHPWVLQFADSLARDSQLLERQLSQGTTDDTNALGAFLAVDGPDAASAHFLSELITWALQIADDLEPATRLFFLFLCCLQERDRRAWILESNWDAVWSLLQMPRSAPVPRAMYPELVTAGLIQCVLPEGEDVLTVRLHPGLAEAGYGCAGPDLRDAVDHEMIRFWFTQMVAHRDALPKEFREDAVIVRAGLSAFPYVARAQRWNVALSMLAEIVHRDSSPYTLSVTLPLVRTTAAALAGTSHGLAARVLLGKVLLRLRSFIEAEDVIRGALKDAVKSEDPHQTKIVMSELLRLLRDTGRPEMAMEYYNQTKEFMDALPVGPWTRVNDEAGQIQTLLQLNRFDEVVRDAKSLVARMKTLPDPPLENDDLVTPWSVREVVLSTGYAAAIAQRDWAHALTFNERLVKSMRSRGAKDLEVARVMVNSCGPLIELGRLGKHRRFEQALRKLRQCRKAAEKEQDRELLGAVFTAFAGCYSAAHQVGAAVAQQKTSLRYAYETHDHAGARIGHTNLAIYMGDEGDERGAACHGFAGAMLAFLTGDDFTIALQRVAWRFAQLGAKAQNIIPDAYETVHRSVEAVDGVRFDAVVNELLPGDATREELFTEVRGMLEGYTAALARAVSAKRVE
ncbi:MAG: hypothetical protein JWM87_1366 [Candidatus Eremiobacteraeota bacterium]|nr:hypothetical protein [Candidatus Eremiobacteraeota bacterium]